MNHTKYDLMNSRIFHVLIPFFQRTGLRNPLSEGKRDPRLYSPNIIVIVIQSMVERNEDVLSSS